VAISIRANPFEEAVEVYVTVGIEYEEKGTSAGTIALGIVG